MLIHEIREQLFSIPEVAAWPEMRQLIERPTKTESKPCWDYTEMACRAVGGTAQQAVPGAGAIFCMMYSIHLADDLLDQDPDGLYHQLGEGPVANIALAFQAASSGLIERAGLAPNSRAAIHANLAQTALATAYGQALDLTDCQGEDEYWKVVEAKAPPLFGAALYIGAVLGGASLENAEGLKEIGFLLGKGVQISDDLGDAMEKPAQPDWHRKWNNLPILYAMTADHKERSRFLDLLSRIEDTEALVEAQEILVRSGAFSYCAYKMIEIHRCARENLQKIPLADDTPMTELLDHHMMPLKSLFKTLGVESPDDLFA